MKKKRYIIKETMRSKGQIEGQHYIVWEVLSNTSENSSSSLKNQNPENPESGESGVWDSRTLLSIDKLNIDKPNKEESNSPPTITNLVGTPTPTPGGVFASSDSLLEINQQVQTVFNLICELNPEEVSKNWKMNDADFKLIKKAIDELGFLDVQLLVYERSGRTDKPYYSVSYFLSDLKENKATLKPTSENIDNIGQVIFDDMEADQAITECQDSQEVFDFICKSVAYIYPEAKYWKVSDEDLEYCEYILAYSSIIHIAVKLRNGLKSAFEKDEWRFGQIVYQFVSAVENRQLHHS